MTAGAETVTVLFTDVVDSTGMRVRLGDDAADDVRVDLQRTFTTSVETNRGRIVKGVGDGVMAVFDAAAEAVEASVAAQQLVHADNAGRPEPVGLRVGLAAGDVTVEEGDYHGLPVVEAARLCDACAGGQILASETVRLLSGARVDALLCSSSSTTSTGRPSRACSCSATSSDPSTPRGSCSSARTATPNWTGSTRWPPFSPTSDARTASSESDSRGWQPARSATS